jgi:hypothetical protein
MTMRLVSCLAVLVSLSLPAAAVAQAPASQTAPAAAAQYTTADTDVGTLLDNPDTKLILTKYLPELVNSPQIDMARSMTLRTMQNYAPDKLTDETLTKIDADLAKVTVKK